MAVHMIVNYSDEYCYWMSTAFCCNSQGQITVAYWTQKVCDHIGNICNVLKLTRFTIFPPRSLSFTPSGPTPFPKHGRFGNVTRLKRLKPKIKIKESWRKNNYLNFHIIMSIHMFNSRSLTKTVVVYTLSSSLTNAYHTYRE